MKTKIIAVCAASLLTASALLAGSEEAARKSSSEFERMKSLVGTWTGQADMGQGPVEMTVEYRLLAGGSVLEERVFSGTPHEMVTMYYDKDGQLALTHYCVLGNRPAMLLKSADAKSLRFDFDKSCGINVAKEWHMHALTIRFDDPDTITTRCKSYKDGKAQPEHPTTLKRVKS
jgi:hypothetical protein